MLIAQISDTHILADGAAAERRAAALERTIRHLNDMRPAPLAVVHTGDIVHTGRPREYEAAQRQLAKLTVPLVLAVGNRDDRAEARAAFGDLDGRLAGSPFIQFAVDLGPVRVLVLDTAAERHGLGEACAARQQDAEQRLAALEPPIVVALHHPPAPMPSLHGATQFRDAAEAEALTRILARSPGVIGIIAGHIHREDVVAVGATHLTTAPSLAVDLRKGRYGAHLASSAIFQMHEIGPRGLRTTRVVIGLDERAEARRS